MNKKNAMRLLARYLILLALGANGAMLIDVVAAPLTAFPVYFILNIFYGAQLLVGNRIFFQGNYIELIKACTGTLAIYLLLILNLSTPMQKRQRIRSLFFIILSFIALNIARILIFAMLFAEGYKYFNIAHELTWYFGSTIMVLLIWFANIYLFKIRSLPVYTDISGLIKEIRPRRKIHHN
jgi:exosortase/archaeosortase family protein